MIEEEIRKSKKEGFRGDFGIEEGKRRRNESMRSLIAHQLM